jgi:hypothetical protein
MQAIIQIIKVNDSKKGVKDGREWEIQDCECILLNDDGSPSSVGVLSLPKDLRGKVSVGIYTGAFALRPDLRTRRIEAVLVSLHPYAVKKPGSAS